MEVGRAEFTESGEGGDMHGREIKNPRSPSLARLRKETGVEEAVVWRPSYLGIEHRHRCN
jgi:hypothetical protein